MKKTIRMTATEKKASRDFRKSRKAARGKVWKGV